MASSWPEIKQAADENRHEIVLTGAEISKRIEVAGLDKKLYRLVGLNFLELSKTVLTSLNDDLSNLVNLTSLVLHSNHLSSVPNTIGKLSKLKLLDLSGNKLESLPDEMSQLSLLESMNVSSNQLSTFPCVAQLTELHILDISNNQLTELPEGITDPNLAVLSQISASDNQIEELPDDMNAMVSLKTLNVENNKLTQIPAEISECYKLKDFNFRGNKLKDRRLAKMMDQCTTKSVLDHLRKELGAKQRGGKGSKDDDKKKKKKKGKKEKGDDLEDIIKNMVKVLHFDDEAGMTIKALPEVASVRPYIACCIVRHLDFQKTKNMFKRFITLQTKLHDGICQKRQAATIATHDLKAVRGPLVYGARDPKKMKLVPLFKHKEVTGEQLVAKLREEAEELRKEKKRNTLSGIHKYLDLLKNKPMYPCLVDSEGIIVSFPPITNCDITKVSPSTTDILIEVTSSTTLDVCKKAMDELLQRLLEMGVGNEAGSSQTEAGSSQTEAGVDLEQEGAAGGDDLGGEGLVMTSGQHLVVEQVRILDPEGTMKVVYPSRTDLQNEAFQIIRN